MPGSLAGTHSVDKIAGIVVGTGADIGVDFVGFHCDGP